MKKLSLLGFIFFLVIILDQLSKIIADFFGLVSLNYGFALGIFSSSSSITFLNFLFLIFFCFFAFYYKMDAKALTVILASGSSNLIDRILFSGVRDWIFIPLFNIKNNLADWLIFLVIIFLLISTHKEEKNNAD